VADGSISQVIPQAVLRDIKDHIIAKVKLGELGWEASPGSEDVLTGHLFVPLRQKCVITDAICASQKIADNEGLNMIENRQCLERASESIVKNHGRSRQDSEN
jgi:hypothetical protein